MISKFYSFKGYSESQEKVDVKICNKKARKKVREKEYRSMPASPKEQKKKERKDIFKLNCIQV